MYLLIVPSFKKRKKKRKENLLQPVDRHSSEGRQKKSKNEGGNQDKWKINAGKIK